MTLAEQYQELVDAGYTPDEASAYVTPAGEPNRYAQEEVSRLGGFIGDPSKPGSNMFTTAVLPNGISSYSPPPNMPSWMVQPAGQAASIPGVNAQSALDFQDAYGIDPRKLDDERKIVVGTLSGSEEPPPQKEIDAIDAGYKDAFNRLGPILAAGTDAKEAVDSVYGPLRSSAKELMLGGRHKQKQEIDPKEKFYRDQVVKAGEESAKAAQEADAAQRGVDQINPATTNAPPLFKRLGAAVGLFDTPQPTVIPESMTHTNAFTEPQVFKAVAKAGAAKAAFDTAMKNYTEYKLHKAGTTPGLDSTFEFRSGAGTNSPLKIGRFTVIPQ